MARRKAQELPAGLTEAGLDELLTGATTIEDVEGVFRQIKKALVERILRGELTAHLGYPGGTAPPNYAERPPDLPAASLYWTTA